jgi:uncharacterized membrane protein YjjP (DUF1212 family)
MALNAKQSFLIDAAMLLHRYGAPSHRLERVMNKVAKSIGIRGEFLYTPTALVISLDGLEEDTHVTVVRRVDFFPVDVDKLIRFDDLLGKVERAELSVPAASDELKKIDHAPSLYSKPIYTIACVIACMCVAVFFRGTTAEVLAAGIVGLLVTIVELLHERWRLERGLLEPVAGMTAAISALLLSAYAVPIDDRLVTLAGLIVLIPGLRLTVALTELAVGHLSAGVARLAGAMVCLATLFVGVALVWRLMGDLRPAVDVAVQPIAEYWQWIALAIAPISFAIVFSAGRRQWPIIALVSILGVTVSRVIEPRYGIELASFFGSFAVGCGSNLYARIRDRPALVPLTPGMLILVPGSLGYRSLSALLEQQTIEGVQFGFAMLLIGVALVGGLLASNAILPPKRIL